MTSPIDRAREAAREPQLMLLEVTSSYYDALKNATEPRVGKLSIGQWDGVTVEVNPLLPDGFELWQWSDGLRELYRQKDGKLLWRGSDKWPITG